MVSLPRKSQRCATFQSSACFLNCQQKKSIYQEPIGSLYNIQAKIPRILDALTKYEQHGVKLRLMSLEIVFGKQNRLRMMTVPRRKAAEICMIWWSFLDIMEKSMMTSLRVIPEALIEKLLNKYLQLMALLQKKKAARRRRRMWRRGRHTLAQQGGRCSGSLAPLKKIVLKIVV